MDFIKKNKFTIIAVLVFLIVVILIARVMNLFTPEESRAIYGNRLEDKINITNNTKKEMKNNLKSDGMVSKSSIRISGRIVEVMVTVNAEVDKNAAKSLTGKITDELNSKELKYYDIQIFIKKDSDSTDFPIIGYKQHNKDSFSWTKDR